MRISNRKVLVNQIGYPTKGNKLVILRGSSSAFHIRDTATSEVVYSAQTHDKVEDLCSGDHVYQGDFSAFEVPGQYRIEDSEGNVSSPFIISEQPYVEVHGGLMKAFYYLRCGEDLDEEYAGVWSHKACHTSQGSVHTNSSQRLDGNGGWHDAGDYGKYVVAGAKALVDLMLSWELYPNAFVHSIPLPETDGIMPDVLHECKVELEFLLKMQDAATGGSYHKLTTKQFPGLDVMPEEDEAELVFAPISATATAASCAVMAVAARIYNTYDAEFADKCLTSAKYSWTWLEKHPNEPGFRNPPDILTGEYGDACDLDERYWAATELYFSTGDSVYHDAVKRYVQKDFPKCELGWADMGGYGTIRYLLADKQEKDAALYAELKSHLLNEADRLLQIVKQDGYGISLKEEDYIWGSNMVVMNRAMLLLLAHKLCGNVEYEQAALGHVHYILGLNVLDLSYVTGFGEYSVMHPHHRPSVGDGVEAPVPGMLAGGPNKYLNDECMRTHLQGKPAAACYIDDKDSYAGNEITIYWNSPAVFVFSHWNEFA
ncbi:glycoside hydrolase family 9 protein [Paenibacillus provencensis]|uniref:Endoglucanase n=1 Tax=Paenibacillus provencensis TaxID=441151 RepID=B7U9C9_9BACL|nr:glycoside hydrolase family 9 protein [Paenibacillus sp. MER 78]ACJ68032.1 beta-1,4-endo-glucanase [Paenibacillus provencensis]MCM3128894.1 glycoside hydrolase family 9 protein [Paenibacillus sp. MER 78]